jgi:Lon-like ATP-dependent protease
VVVVSYPNLTGFSGVIGIIQIVFVVVVGLYFWNLLRSQQGTRVAVDRESKKELEKIQRLRRISLAEPLAERTRPQRFEEIIGQEEGLKALRAALCGPNPQHVLIYGSPGVGKTAAARLVLEEAKTSTAQFVTFFLVHLLLYYLIQPITSPLTITVASF